MKVFVRDDLNYQESSINGFDVVSIENRFRFKKHFVGQIGKSLSTNENIHRVKFEDNTYQFIPSECLVLVVEVKKVGERRGFCREYYQNIKTKALYARQEDFRDSFGWYSCTQDGEPDCHLKDEIVMYDVENDKIYRVWRKE